MFHRTVLGIPSKNLDTFFTGEKMTAELFMESAVTVSYPHLGIYRPAFIIGVPVGFVNVEVAKEMILHTDVPCIVNRGRKGGSNVAAAICNALLYEVRREDAAKKVD